MTPELRARIVFACACLATSTLVQAQRPAVVRGDRVREESIQDRRFVTGELRASRRSSVATREPGLVAKMLVREGQRVGEGVELAVIDDARLQIEKLQIQADRAVVNAAITEYEADLAFAQWQLEAYTKLEQRGSSYEKELREARAAIDMAQAKVLQQQKQLDVLDAREKLIDRRVLDMTIVAPFAGVCVMRHVEKGEWVAAGSPLADLVATDVMEAWFDLPEELAPALTTKGLAVELHVEAVARKQFVKEFRVVPELNRETRTFPLVLTLENGDGQLKARMSATAWIPLDVEKDHLTVPKDAVMRSETGLYVYAARGPQPSGLFTATPVPIVGLFETGDRIAIRPGSLQAQDLVVVEGNERLFPGTPLAVQEVTETKSQER